MFKFLLNSVKSCSNYRIPGRVGVSYFMAPEVVCDAEYGTKADMWSAGVLLYILLCGRLPFVGARQGVYEGITEGRYSVCLDSESQ